MRGRHGALFAGVIVANVAILAPRPCGAQAGTVHITGAAQAIQGDPRRTDTLPELEPDLGITWFQPRTRLGTVHFDLRGTRRDGSPHLGRVAFSARDLKRGAVSWTVDAGDTFFSPAIGDYRFANLSTPALTFAGAGVAARATRVSAGLVAGRSTMSRNVFGTDPDALDQTVLIGRAAYKASDRLEIMSRGSRVRSGDLGAYASSIEASDQGGVAARWIVTPAVHLIGDGAVVSYRRRGAASREVDGSGVAGASFLLSRGWIQVNATRFSPGELPLVNQPLADRQSLFAAGEIDAFRRLRVFGGGESFRTNLQPDDVVDPPGIAVPAVPASNGTRGFAGIRSPIGTRSSVAFRVERGDRRSGRDDDGARITSDTGIVTAEWQTSAGAVSGVARYSRRDNVESSSQTGSYTLNDASGHVFVSLGPATQIFGNATATRTTRRDGGGSTFWQVGGGGQLQMRQRSLWLRTEGSASRNADVLSAITLPQQSFSIGLNGEILRRTVLGINVNADRLETSRGSGAWVARSSVRVTRSFDTTAPRTPTSIASALARHGGTGSIAGVVYTDWNANGRRDADEPYLENIPVRLATLGSSTTSPAGEFAFTNVPIGMLAVGIDLQALPVDFDPPAVPEVQLQLGRGETKRVAFGLIPLGSVSGRVVLDANGNGAADEGERSIDGAIVVLDGGARSERVRRGRFNFEAVRSGDHSLTLLADSLPEGTDVTGTAEIPIELSRRTPATEAVFLVALRTRAELRKVFAPAAPVAAPAPARVPARVPPARSPAAAPRSTAAVPRTVLQRPADPTGARRFAVQIVAFNDSTRARNALEALLAEGLPAYMIEPSPADPDAPYRVRIGGYQTRAEAEQAAAALARTRGGKLWVVSER